MLKHNKKKNTAILYEQLMVLSTRLALQNKTKELEYVVEIIKEYFNPSRELYKEKKVFDCVLNACVKHTSDAEYILEECLSELKLIDQKNLETEKYNLINEIYRSFGKDFFAISIKDYKLRASLSILSEEIRKNFLYSTPVERTKIKKILIENMVNSYTKKQEENEYPKDNLTYKIIVEKFNKRYSSVLNDNQKEVLSSYLEYLIDENKEFSQLLKKKSKYILSEIELIESESLNKEFSERLNEVKQELESKDFNIINEDSIYMIMRCFDLIDDLKEYINE